MTATNTKLPAPEGIRKIFNLDGRTAVITGGASGLGRSIAWGLASFGADIALLDLNGEEAAKVASAIQTDLGRKAASFAVDMRDEASVNHAFSCIEGAFPTLDILVNGAGHNIRKAMVRMSQTEFDSLYEVHVRGAYLASKAAIPIMQRQNRGSIINIASIAGQVGIPEVVPYAAAKGALIQMVKALALELATSGIRVNAIAPGYIDTPLTRQHTEAVRKSVSAQIPLNRFGNPEEMIGPAIFLASDASSYVTGATLLADGGWTAQ